MMEPPGAPGDATMATPRVMMNGTMIPRLGSSLFVMQLSESVISVCYNSSLLKYGGDVAVGAMTILTSVMHTVSTHWEQET